MKGMGRQSIVGRIGARGAGDMDEDGGAMADGCGFRGVEIA